LVKIAKHRWIIERDHEELRQELGLGHYEGRGWRGFHHHATLCIAAYGFLVAERIPSGFKPCGSPRPAPNVIIPIGSQQCAFSSPGIFSSNSLDARFALHGAADYL
jgi:hypothetical protein